MGFFGSLFSAIGQGIEMVGDFFGSEIISNIGRGVQDFFAERVAGEKSYNKKDEKEMQTESGEGHGSAEETVGAGCALAQEACA